MASWVEIPTESDSSLRNLPYGVFSTASLSPRIGTDIGPYVLNLKALAQDGVFSSIPFDSSTRERPTLNEYASLGKDVHLAVRKLLLEILKKDTLLGTTLRDNEERKRKVLSPLSDAKMHLPMQIGDYTDFFVGVHHARNVSMRQAPERVLSCS
jgi:fumarylacetoacetase